MGSDMTRTEVIRLAQALKLAEADGARQVVRDLASRLAVATFEPCRSCPDSAACARSSPPGATCLGYGVSLGSAGNRVPEAS